MTETAPRRYPMPFVRIELALLAMAEGGLNVLLGKRQEAPWKGRWALPGGVLRVELDAGLDEAAARVAKERLNVVPPYMRQMGAVGGPTRDPRAPWALSVVYRGMIDGTALAVVPGKRMEALKWWPVDDVEPAAKPAFDHGELIRTAVGSLREEIDRLELPFGALPATFTLGELQAWCEAALARRLDKSSFRRRLDDRGIVEPVPGAMRTGPNRPAQLYRARSLTT